MQVSKKLLEEIKQIKNNCHVNAEVKGVYVDLETQEVMAVRYIPGQFGASSWVEEIVPPDDQPYYVKEGGSGVWVDTDGDPYYGI